MPPRIRHITDPASAMSSACSSVRQEALLESPSDYKCFNDFFYRKLKPAARPISAPDDPNVVVSAADCRCGWVCGDG